MAAVAIVLSANPNARLSGRASKPKKSNHSKRKVRHSVTLARCDMLSPTASTVIDASHY